MAKFRIKRWGNIPFPLFKGTAWSQGKGHRHRKGWGGGEYWGHEYSLPQCRFEAVTGFLKSK